MELKLQQLVDKLLRVAQLRNLNDDNPIKITLENPNIHGSTIVIVAVYEPFIYPLPMNVTWICADAESRFYHLPLKRVNKETSINAYGFKHTWIPVNAYSEVFHPPQFYDDGDITPEDVLHQEFLEHLRSKSNPHEVNAEQIQALPIRGGTLSGPLFLYRSPVGNNEAAHKQYVDSSLTDLAVDLSNINNGLIVQTVRLDNVDSDVQSLDFSLNQLKTLPNRVLGFRFVKSFAEDVWNIEHNLNTDFISVSIYDSSSALIYPNECVKVSKNSMRINFLTPKTGIAALSGILL